METQTSSRPRVKNDGIGEDTMRTLYSHYDTIGVDDFRSMCKSAIDASAGKADTKRTFHEMLDSTSSKKVMLIKMTNYFLAGEGKGV
jgi:hypothetical protein